jgi:hypothetical protein
MVMGLYPAFLTHRRTNPASGPFQNSVTLFKGWYARKAQGPIFEQLKRFQSDGARLPPPIGTRLDSKTQGLTDCPCEEESKQWRLASSEQQPET